ncbi:MAG TPA: hypothetical protein VE076_04795, partial [Nitrososphaeraceae archaeon]|nr:hypothetical protein [Nitrososphaeraceae archaeon]
DYLGGAAMLPINVGGKGLNAGQAHEIRAPYVESICSYPTSYGWSNWWRNGISKSILQFIA